MSDLSKRTTISVAVCTYNRNEALRALLHALLKCANSVQHRAAVGVVVVDDTAEGKARPVAEDFSDRFELGLTYRISGRQNISLARNMAIETAMDLAEWTAMTDDDCEPVPEWLSAFLDVQRQTGADAVTGAMVRPVPSNSPRWLTEEPFLELGIEHRTDCFELTTASTNNSMIRSDWLKKHPHIRFEPDLGVIGGEDMVFYRTARAAGLRIHFSKKGLVYEPQPSSRTTLSYQLRRFFWQGNSSYVTCVETGIPPVRMFAHGLTSLARALTRPWLRLLQRKNPQFRYCLACALEAVGKIIGFVGIRVKHPS